jgi:hypothetical protein
VLNERALGDELLELLGGYEVVLDSIGLTGAGSTGGVYRRYV